MIDGSDGDGARMWHVTVTVAGEPADVASVRAALERLGQERPFLLSMRYGDDRAELRYWEQACCADDAAALGLRLWGEHRLSAGLPAWSVVGLEVVDRETHQRRAGAVPAALSVVPAGQLTPF